MKINWFHDMAGVNGKSSIDIHRGIRSRSVAWRFGAGHLDSLALTNGEGQRAAHTATTETANVRQTSQRLISTVAFLPC
jgi:hypothetical protein